MLKHTKKKNKKKEKAEPLAFGMTQSHLLIIIALIAVVTIALIAHTILRPDRNAELTILYTGDMQGKVAYTAGSYAGYEKIGALKQEIAAEGKNVMLLDAGNCLGSNAVSEVDDGKSIITLMNAAGYDAMIPGPMDFIYGPDGLSALRAQAAFPVLAANIEKTDGSHAFETYKILTINSVRVGVIGVTEGLSENQAQKASLTIIDPAEAVTKVIGELEGKTDTIIVLAYSGDKNTIQSIAAIEGVSLVIVSGSEELVSEEAEDGTMIVSAGSYGKSIGAATVEVTSGRTQIVNQFYGADTYDRLTSDSTVTDALTTFSATQTAAKNIIAGSITLIQSVSDNVTSAEIESASESDDDVSKEVIANHTVETALGDLIADAMLEAGNADSAAIALIQDQSINYVNLNGSVTRGQIESLFANDLYMVTCRMTGGELRTVLENSFDGYPAAKGFLQVSGITYTYTPGTQIGTKLSSIQVSGHTLDDARTYVVAMTNTLAVSLGFTSGSSGRIGEYRCMANVLNDYLQSSSPDTSTTVQTESESETESRIVIN